MAIKVTGYKVFVSTGGNNCIQCDTRMRKGIPYVSPVRNKKNPVETKGKSICMSCLRDIYTKSMNLLGEEGLKELDLYDKRRFLDKLG